MSFFFFLYSISISSQLVLFLRKKKSICKKNRRWMMEWCGISKWQKPAIHRLCVALCWVLQMEFLTVWINSMFNINEANIFSLSVLAYSLMEVSLTLFMCSDDDDYILGRTTPIVYVQFNWFLISLRDFTELIFLSFKVNKVRIYSQKHDAIDVNGIEFMSNFISNRSYD